ncbi:unnamed protein product, partial [Brenthis ino]
MSLKLLVTSGLLCLILQKVVPRIIKPTILTPSIPVSINERKIIFLTNNGNTNIPNAGLIKNKLSTGVVTNFGQRLHRINILNLANPIFQVPHNIFLTIFRPYQNFKPSEVVPSSVFLIHPIDEEKPAVVINLSSTEPTTNTNEEEFESTSSLPEVQATTDNEDDRHERNEDDDNDYDINIRKDLS